MYSDLNEEIVSDDWLVPSEEISRKRLIKQTPRYNIFKADWFGDVLVYEPADNHLSNQQMKRSNKSEGAQVSPLRQHESFRFDQHDLNFRLSKLNLNHSRSSSPFGSQMSSINSGSECDLTTDSAYSSISSTPQYHTKNIKSEFEFPCSLPPTSPSRSSTSSYSLSTEDDSEFGELGSCWLASELVSSEKQLSTKSESKLARKNKNKVILNKDSYTFGQLSQTTTTAAKHQEQDGCNKLARQSSWFELNELRLVAHESFMLFMGASMDLMSDSNTQATSLVMQMNHPKAISLYNLLHTSKLLPGSPLDR